MKKEAKMKDANHRPASPLTYNIERGVRYILLVVITACICSPWIGQYVYRLGWGRGDLGERRVVMIKANHPVEGSAWVVRWIVISFISPRSLLDLCDYVEFDPSWPWAFNVAWEGMFYGDGVIASKQDMVQKKVCLDAAAIPTSGLWLGVNVGRKRKPATN